MKAPVMAANEKPVEKRNLVIIVCISSLLLFNVLLALYNWGIFEGLTKSQQNLRVKVKIPKINRLVKEKIEKPTTTLSPTTTSTKKPHPSLLKKNRPIKFTFTKMIRFVPKKLLRSEKANPDFSSLPVPGGFDSIFPPQGPPTAFDDLPPLDPISLPGPFPFMHEGPSPHDVQLPPHLGHFLSKLMPNLDEMVRDLLGPHENPTGNPLLPPWIPPARPSGELMGDCLVCTFDEEGPKLEEGPKEPEAKVTEVKAVLPQSIFPEERKKKGHHSLLIFMSPKKFEGRELGKMDPLPPFLPPMPLMDFPGPNPMAPPAEFSGILPSSFPFHLIREEGETPEKDLMSMLADTMHGKGGMDEEQDGDFEPILPEEPGIKIIHSEKKSQPVMKEKAVSVGPAPNGGLKKPAKEDTVPIFSNLDFEPKAVKPDDIEKLATLETVGSKNKGNKGPGSVK